MKFLSANKATFNEDLSSWDTLSVTDMGSMFDSADFFNGDLSLWDTSSVLSIGFMFESVTSFNDDLSLWDTLSVTDMFGVLLCHFLQRRLVAVGYFE